MTEYLVELYLPAADRVPAAAARARAAAEQLAGEGRPIRYLRSIFIPSDQTCFLVFEAPSEDAVREAGNRAAVTFTRVVEAMQLDDNEPKGAD